VRRLPARAVFVTSVLLVAACGGGKPSTGATGEQPAADTTAAAQPSAAQAAAQGQDTTPVRRFLPAEARRATRAERFPHEYHVGIACRTCHKAPEGHTTHAGVGCPQCHRSSAFVTQRVLTKTDCMSCHHGGTNGRSCLDCHKAPPAPLVVQEQIKLSVWPTARTRSLPFDHARHKSFTCKTCHQAMPNLKPTVSCGTCHEKHHQPTARCMTCHRQPPAGAHTLAAHLNCNAAGCHNEPVTEHMTETRNICLVCHQDRENHEPGKVCAQCHQVRPGGAAGAKGDVRAPPSSARRQRRTAPPLSGGAGRGVAAVPTRGGWR